MYSSTFLIVAVILVVAWALGGFVFHVAGGVIHAVAIASAAGPRSEATDANGIILPHLSGEG